MATLVTATLVTATLVAATLVTASLVTATLVTATLVTVSNSCNRLHCHLHEMSLLQDYYTYSINKDYYLFRLHCH